MTAASVSSSVSVQRGSRAAGKQGSRAAGHRDGRVGELERLRAAGQAAQQAHVPLPRVQKGLPRAPPPALGDTLGAIARVRRAHLLHDRHMTVT